MHADLNERVDIDQTSDSDDEASDLHEAAEQAKEEAGVGGDDLGDTENGPPHPG